VRHEWPHHANSARPKHLVAIRFKTMASARENVSMALLQLCVRVETVKGRPRLYDLHLLNVPRVQTWTRQRSFTVLTSLASALPDNYSQLSLNSFRRKLKIHVSTRKGSPSATEVATRPIPVVVFVVIRFKTLVFLSVAIVSVCHCLNSLVWSYVGLDLI